METLSRVVRYEVSGQFRNQYSSSKTSGHHKP